MSLNSFKELPDKIRARILLEEYLKRRRETKLLSYKPSKKQLEFHSAGKDWSERLFMAGNQLGKTLAGGFEFAMHLTGRYPNWWAGRRFEKPVSMWAASVSAESTRDNPQRILLGDTEEKFGEGAIPKENIEFNSIRRGTVPGAISHFLVKHVSGGLSKCQFKTYEQGRQKWQGPTLDGVWFDEESPEDIYFEGLTRTNNGQLGQFVFTTFTPLLGMSNVVNRFLSEDSEMRGKYTAVVKMGLRDADHYTDEQKEQILASYPSHEREARANGNPILGSGRVFPIGEESIKIDPFSIPPHFHMIIGVDFGWDHPASVVKLAYDKDNDTVYVVNVWRQREAKISDHAAAIRAMGGNEIPVAWPHDGLQHDKNSGEQIAELLKKEGVNMLPEKASYPDSLTGKGHNTSVEAGIYDMMQRMSTGRLKIFSTCSEWWEEFSLYHRKNGMLVKERDDVICAVRYAIMMLRFSAISAPAWKKANKVLSLGGDNAGWVV